MKKDKSKSFGEKKIRELLISNDIPFAQQYHFKGNPRVSGMGFDFFINMDYLVELDGPQHYDVGHPWFSDYLAADDMLKNEFSLKSGLPLYRIPSSIIKKKNLKLSTLQDEQYLVREKDHYGLLKPGNSDKKDRYKCPADGT